MTAGELHGEALTDSLIKQDARSRARIKELEEALRNCLAVVEALIIATQSEAHRVPLKNWRAKILETLR